MAAANANNKSFMGTPIYLVNVDLRQCKICSDIRAFVFEGVHCGCQKYGHGLKSGSSMTVDLVEIFGLGHEAATNCVRFFYFFFIQVYAEI